MRALLAAAAAALVLGALPAGAAPPATVQPGQLTVGVSLPSDGFEVGVVKGTEVIYADSGTIRKSLVGDLLPAKYTRGDGN